MATEAQAIVERFFAAVLSQDVAAVKELVSPDCILHEPAELPYGGEYQGPDGLLAMFAAIGADYDFTINEAQTFDAGEGRVVGRLRGTFTSRRSGRSVELPVAEIYATSGGQIVDIDVYYKDPGAVRTLHDAG